MTKLFAFCFVACPLFSVSVSTAQDNASFEGTWKIDIAKTDFGSDPPLKSLIVTFSKAGPDSLSIRANGVDPTGKRFSHSWVGPTDGSMHPLNKSLVSRVCATKEMRLFVTERRPMVQRLMPAPLCQQTATR